MPDDQSPNLPTPLPASRPTWPELSTRLADCLEDRAVYRIADAPELVDELRRSLPAMLARRDHPAGHDGVKQTIGRRFALCPQPERSEGEWAAWWADYRDALETVPLVSLEAAMRTWVQRPESQFLPKPGELRALALDSVTREGIRCQTASQALKHASEQQRHEEAFVAESPAWLHTEDERAAVKKLVDEFLVQAKARAKAPPAMRANHGKTDEHGITAEMRELLARQRPA